MSDELPIRVDVVLVNTDTERRYVERNVQDAKEDERQLGGHRRPQSTPTCLAKIEIGVEAVKSRLARRFANVEDPAIVSQLLDRDAEDARGDNVEDDRDHQEVSREDERVMEARCDETQQHCQQQRWEPKCDHVHGLEEEAERLEVVLESIFRLESTADFEAGLDEKDADTANTSDQDMARKEANQYSQS